MDIENNAHMTNRRIYINELLFCGVGYGTRNEPAHIVVEMIDKLQDNPVQNLIKAKIPLIVKSFSYLVFNYSSNNWNLRLVPEYNI